MKCTACILNYSAGTPNPLQRGIRTAEDAVTTFEGNALCRNHLEQTIKALVIHKGYDDWVNYVDEKYSI